MKILLLSFYYPPDIGPGPLRAASIVEALSDEAGDKMQLDVYTTVPNRYHSLAINAAGLEWDGRAAVLRIPLPQHHSGMIDQAKAFLSFAHGVLNASRGKHWDIVVATSSRLMTAVLGAWIAKKSGAKLYLDIRDLFADTIEGVLSKSAFKPLLPIFQPLERWTFRSAHRLNVVSAGFLPHIRKVAPQLEARVFTNGTDDEFAMGNFATAMTDALPLVVYTGNIGDGQGLHHIIPVAAKALEGQARFRLIGDGGRRKELEEALTEKHIKNVDIFDPVPRHELLAHYRAADVLLLHLNDLQVFHHVLPSKIFEYAATGKPILAGVAGYAAEFLKAEVSGVEIFRPCDAVAMKDGLSKLLQGPRMFDRSDFSERFSRKRIMRDMARDILSTQETGI